MSFRNLMLSAFMTATSLTAAAQAPQKEGCKDELRFHHTTGALSLMDPCMGVSHGEFRITSDTLCKPSEIPAQLVVSVTEETENLFRRSFEIQMPHGISTLRKGNDFPTSLLSDQIIGDVDKINIFQYVSIVTTKPQDIPLSQKVKTIPGCVSLRPAKILKND